MVLDDLYCGNIYPAEQVVPHEKEYRKLHRHTGELLTELEEKLSKEQMELVNQFHTHVIDVHCMELEAHFQYGFSLGLMLMKEVYELLEVVSRVMRKFDLALAEIYFRGRVHAPWLPSSGQGAKGQGRRYAARLALDAL